MIKKMTSLRAPVAQVQELFGDIEAWPQWMPGIRRVRVLDKTADRARVEVKTVMLGREFEQTMEFCFRGSYFLQKQLAGRFKKWEAEWRLLPSPDGKDTVLSMALDVDFGFLGMFVSPKTVSNTVNDWFSQLTVKAEARVKQKQPRPAPPAAAVLARATSDETLLQVFQTADGLEVWFRQQRYFIPVSPALE